MILKMLFLSLVYNVYTVQPIIFTHYLHKVHKMSAK